MRCFPERELISQCHRCEAENTFYPDKSARGHRPHPAVLSGRATCISHKKRVSPTIGRSPSSQYRASGLCTSDKEKHRSTRKRDESESYRVFIPNHVFRREDCKPAFLHQEVLRIRWICRC